MKAYALVFLIVFLFGFKNKPAVNGYVLRVMDGDTFEMIVHQDTFKVRMAGIDAPEKRQDYGNVSKQYLRNTIEGKEIKNCGERQR
jgi:micrococcal nuclease